MYQGMSAKLLHTVLTSALLFVGYERLVQVKEGKFNVKKNENVLVSLEVSLEF